MRISVILFLIAFGFYSCADKKSDTPPESAPKVEKESKFPESLEKIIEAHGGLSQWNSFKSLAFTVTKEEQSTHFKTELKTHKTFVENPSFKMGFDGNGNWFQSENNSFNKTVFEKQSRVLTATKMPFAVDQKGVFYTQRLDQTFQRNTYGVVHVGFGRESGKSSDVEYIIYYDKDTFKIAWLAQSVVENDRYKRKYWEFIKYHSFQTKNDLLFPEKVTVYSANENQPSSPLYSLTIENIELAEEAYEVTVFTAAEGSVFE